MWIWNDYLLPYLVLDIKKYKTIPIAVQYLKGGYGSNRDLPSHGAFTLFFRWRKKSVQKKASGTALREKGFYCPL